MKKLFIILLILINFTNYSIAEQNILTDSNEISVNYQPDNRKKSIVIVEDKSQINGTQMQLNNIKTNLIQKKIRYDNNGMPQFSPTSTTDFIFQ